MLPGYVVGGWAAEGDVGRNEMPAAAAVSWGTSNHAERCAATTHSPAHIYTADGHLDSRGRGCIRLYGNGVLIEVGAIAVDDAPRGINRGDLWPSGAWFLGYAPPATMRWRERAFGTVAGVGGPGQPDEGEPSRGRDRWPLTIRVGISRSRHLNIIPASASIRLWNG